MSHKVKATPLTEPLMCEKYLSKMLRQERAFATKRSPATPVYQEKLSNLAKQSLTISNQRSKPKSNVRQQNPLPKPTPTIVTNNTQKEHGDGLSPLRESPKTYKHRTRSTSRCRSLSRERESWGQMLRNNRSKEKTSSFSNFDPLRTVHFLSKELHIKLQNLVPEEDDILQMISDIQHALKRIPPEVATLLHTHSSDFPVISKSRSSQDLKSYYINSAPMSNKSCQTPPTLYQEDTEKFQKIMEEYTYGLEASCRQLEIMCTNLQSEKEMTEKELDETRENVEFLCKRVKELELEMEEISNMKIKQLEQEKQHLQQELDKAMGDIKDNPTITSLRKLVEDLKKQKSASDDTCAQLEYDMMLLKMEKEKFVTMLSVRDREIKDIQDEITKIQDQVVQQLSKLGGEVLSRVNSMKSISDNKDIFIEIGDATVSSINEFERDPVNVLKERGDGEVAGMTQEQQDNFMQRLVKIKSSNVELNLPSSKDHDEVLEEILKGLTPSCKTLLNNES
ncbi:intracellular protein transport protein USO1-like [Asbolus verrucosus]|uniref:Intracellular protein transport protein USO1-like n=1 Tax=Asbolus verrucosus TaxID=1661398 RepID=A0A482V9P9_ASBVE|nr:intracellular protein transport protein USO1-like [Asbolus verrucosus]